jgi:hypothetical protein
MGLARLIKSGLPVLVGSVMRASTDQFFKNGCEKQ